MIEISPKVVQKRVSPIDTLHYLYKDAISSCALRGIDPLAEVGVYTFLVLITAGWWGWVGLQNAECHVGAVVAKLAQ